MCYEEQGKERGFRAAVEDVGTAGGDGRLESFGRMLRGVDCLGRRQAKWRDAGVVSPPSEALRC